MVQISGSSIQMFAVIVFPTYSRLVSAVGCILTFFMVANSQTKHLVIISLIKQPFSRWQTLNNAVIGFLEIKWSLFHEIRLLIKNRQIMQPFITYWYDGLLPATG
jgi:hypothetical protein